MQFHEELQPKVWDDFRLKPEVKDKLNKIAEAFIEYAEIPEEGIKDIVITGSTANYNYTPYSDLDLHLIIDYDSLHENCPLVENYLWSVKSQFNKEHDISIYGIPVELYAEDMNAGGVSNGIYSLQKDEWIKKPEKLSPTDNDAAVEARYNEFKEAVEKVVDKEDAEEIKNQMYIMRLTGLSEEGELSTENLTFKKLRDNGYLQKLNDIIHTEFDKELSLENKQTRLSKILNKLKGIK